MNFLGLNLIPNASSKEKKEKFYISLKFYFFKWIVSEKPAPVKRYRGKSIAENS